MISGDEVELCRVPKIGGSLTVWFRISRRHTRRVKSEMSKSAKIELCVTKLRLSGLGVGFFDLNI